MAMMSRRSRNTCTETAPRRNTIRVCDSAGAGGSSTNTWSKTLRRNEPFVRASVLFCPTITRYMVDRPAAVVRSNGYVEDQSVATGDGDISGGRIVTPPSMWRPVIMMTQKTSERFALFDDDVRVRTASHILPKRSNVATSSILSPQQSVHFFRNDAWMKVMHDLTTRMRASCLSMEMYYMGSYIFWRDDSVDMSVRRDMSAVSTYLTDCVTYARRVATNHPVPRKYDEVIMTVERFVRRGVGDGESDVASLLTAMYDARLEYLTKLYEASRRAYEHQAETVVLAEACQRCITNARNDYTCSARNEENERTRVRSSGWFCALRGRISREVIRAITFAAFELVRCAELFERVLFDPTQRVEGEISLDLRKSVTAARALIIERHDWNTFAAYLTHAIDARTALKRVCLRSNDGWRACENTIRLCFNVIDACASLRLIALTRDASEWRDELLAHHATRQYVLSTTTTDIVWPRITNRTFSRVLLAITSDDAASVYKRAIAATPYLLPATPPWNLYVGNVLTLGTLGDVHYGCELDSSGGGDGKAGTIDRYEEYFAFYAFANAFDASFARCAFWVKHLRTAILDDTAEFFGDIGLPPTSSSPPPPQFSPEETTAAMDATPEQQQPSVRKRPFHDLPDEDAEIKKIIERLNDVSRFVSSGPWVAELGVVELTRISRRIDSARALIHEYEHTPQTSETRETRHRLLRRLRDAVDAIMDNAPEYKRPRISL